MIITAEPQDIDVNEGVTSTQTLSVQATGNGGLSYQWYRSFGGSTVQLPGKTDSSLTVPTSTPFESYYYVVVTDSLTSVTSRFAHVKVNALPSAPAPTILTQPAGDELDEGDPSPVLSVSATVTGGGTLSYQWYRNTTNDNSGGFMLQGQTGNTYTVPTSGAHDSYYYVVVTNTDNSVAGQKTASTKSGIAHVKVNALPIAPAPTISAGPAGAILNEGEPSPVLSVSAIVTGGGTLSYQWYRNTTNDNMGGVMLQGQTGSTYTVPTGGAHDSYYYVVVTNSVAGMKTASTKSGVAHVKVNALPIAPEPTISADPIGANLNEWAPSPVLSVTAAGSGTLSYQWYRNTTNDNSGGVMLQGQTGSTYTVPTGGAHDSYYYVIVTNTDNSVAGQKTASKKSGIAHVVVNDVTPPTVTVSSAINRPTAQATFVITIQFSEPVTGFDVADIAVTNGSISNFQVMHSQMYTAEITAAADGPVTINIGADVAEDNYGHGNTAATPYVVIHDTTGPTVNISSPVANPTNQSSFVVTLAFNEPALNFSADDITVTNGTAGQLQSTDGLTYTAVIRPTDDGTVTVHMAAGVVNDAAGNANTAAATSFSTVYDATAPTVNITSSAMNPTNSSPFSITIAFSEAVSGFDVSDLTVTNGTVSNWAALDSKTYTADITPTGDGAVTANVAAGVAADAAGNANTAATPYSTVYDAAAPTVSITSSAANPTNQSSFEVTITFSKAVTGFAVSDITVTNGSASNLATSDNLTYTADITPAADGTVTVNVAAGAAIDAAGNGNTAAATPYSTVYDATSPTVSITSSAANPMNQSSFEVTITFSEAVTGFAASDITVTNGSASNLTTSDYLTYTADITPTTDGLVTVSVAAEVANDAAGNGNTAAATPYSTVYDATAPTVSITSSAANPTNQSSFEVTITFSKAVTGFAVSDITVTNGSASNLATSDNLTYTADITPAADGTVTVNVAAGAAIDAAGNGNTAAATPYSTVYDATSPTVSITSSAANPTNQSSFEVTITFSEAVTGFAASDITVTNGSASNLTTSDYLTYTADITPTTDGLVTVSVAAEVANDAAGNGNTAAATPYSTVYDATAPTVSITSSAANPTNQSSFEVTITFSKAVTGFAVSDITVTNGSASNLATSDNLTYTADITPAADGTVTVNVAAGAAIDAAGNGNTAAATPYSTVYDATAPTVSITSSAANPTNQSSFEVTIIFSEAVAGFEASDITVTNGSASNLATSDNLTYTADITPAADGTVTVNVAAGAAIDAAGNGNTAGATPYSNVYDATSPTVSITSSAANPTNQSSFEVTIIFSEAVAGFEASDITVTNGSASNLTTSDNLTYTADITPAADGTVTVNVAAGAAIDAAGNGNIAAATPYSTVYDAKVPVLTSVSFASDNASPSLAKVGDTVTVTFRASETLTDSPVVTIAGHTASVTEVASVYTAVYTMTSDEAEGMIPLRIVFSDIAGNAGTEIVETTDASSVVFDKTLPVPAIVSPNNKTQTTNSRPEIKGTAEPGSTVTITINGKESHVQADSNGEWRYRPENGLPDGKHTFTVKAVDLAGNSSEVQAELIIYIYTEYTPDAETPKGNDIYTDVLINGQPFRIGKLITSRQNGQSVSTLTIDERELERMLAGAGPGAVLTIPVNTDSDVLIGQLNAQLIKNLEQMQAVVEFKTKHATYTLPAQQFNIDTLSKQFANPVNLQDVTIQIEIATPTTEMVQLLERAAEEGAFSVVASPMSFSIRVSYAGTSTEIPKFNLYVERMIALPDGTDPSRITTGVAVEPNGTVRHVPTRIEASGGNYIAHINSLTNSTYALVWHPLEFDDMANHWAKDAVNDMGSRMVINGTGNGRFSPDNDITRAEFAAIIVRGLGLKLESDREAFSDVKSADWYNDAVHVAYAYDLIDGFEDGTFRPNDKITREQAMAIIGKAVKITNGPAAITMTAEAAEEALRSYTDAADASAWARSGIASSVKSGVVSGRSESLLVPKANITRAEVAVIIERLLKQAGLI